MTTEQRGELLVTWRAAAREIVVNRDALRAALLAGDRDRAARLMRAQRALSGRMLKAAVKCGASDDLTAPLLAILEADELTAH